MSSTHRKPAVELFTEAFERLKNNTPINLPEGTPVTQNNVAREAGRDPSALRAERYPDLLLKIQLYISNKKEQGKKSSQNRARKIEKRLSDCKRQRDKLLSIYHSQQTLIEELYDKIQMLEEGKVLDISRKKQK
ncbi:hypothetical protein J0671_19920 [Vibrio sp. Vb0592]|uniref:hypothetical protein n=1 Tax=Vibrio TaxID=662 RepID=UPI001A8D04C0|nr:MULTISPECIES: hypothetical protein [Vibrio]MBO0245662.1 hypothetical protein [Vibrio sp. Vb0592]MCR9637534.1 hypothetical protein [Vibrio alginolyticus]MDW1736335.1 hypothetical protein [Vibrio sp. Vb2235]MDW1788624.1 hypothetical protein [Vibrio sp. Vb2227]MDW1818256.1 hypothetical protein [Vibrio sp. Vb2232]